MGEPNAEVKQMAEDAVADAKPAGKNGKKADGRSGSSFFTWFVVLALLGVWTSVAVVWFELVDYDDVLARAKEFRYNISEVLQGKLGAYDADGDGDFDVEDAKILLGLTKDGSSENSDSLEEVLDILAEEGSDWFYGFLAFLYDVITPFDRAEEEENEAAEEVAEETSVEVPVPAKVKPADEKPDESARKKEKRKGLQDKPAFESKREPVQGDLPVPPVEEPEPEVVEEEEEVIPSYSQDAYAAPEAEAEAEPRVVTEDEEELVLVEEAEVEEPVGGEEESPAVDDDEEQVEVEESPDPEETEHEEEEEMEPAVEDSEPEETLYLDEEEGEFSQGDEEDIQDAAAVSEDSEDVRGSQGMDVESEIQAAVPLPELQEDTGEVDSAAGEAHPYDDNLENVIDTQGEAVQDDEADDEPEETVDELTQEEVQEDQTDRSEDVVDTQGKVLQDTEAEETIAEEPSDGEELSVTEESGAAEELVQAESSPQEEPAGTSEPQQEDKPKEKAKKKKPKLLNKFDKTIKAEIDAAEKLRKKGKLEDAMKAFENLVQKYPQSPRCRYGKAQSEDDVAEKMRSNEILQKAINTYREAAELPDVPADLLRATLKRRAERQQFLGRMRGALATLERLVQIFPEDVSLKNDLGVGYLLLGDNKSAKKIYEEVLSAAPGDGFAKVHYGFILKSENKIVESIPFLQEGLESGDPGTDDGRFFFHLGDALQRMGDSSAYKWYELGHQRGHFASVWQRSLYNVKGLKAQAWWTARETGYTDLVRTLERNWKTIRDEALAVMDTSRGLFLPEDENLREKGEWGQFTLWQQGRKVEKSCQSVPKTCGLLDRYPEATGCKRGQIKYSVMQPGTHVWPHTGPTNCRLRMHLGLVIPATGCRIRCTNDTRAWEEGKVLIFDDSFEHEVWQDAGSYRLIFIVDVWHPELTQYQRQTLTPI